MSVDIETPWRSPGEQRTAASSLTASRNRGVSAVVEKVANVPRTLTTKSNGKPATRSLKGFRPVVSKTGRNWSNTSKAAGLSGPS